MSYETLIWEVSDGLGRLTLNRPESLNAWTIPFGEEMKAVIEGEAADPSVRAVLITGAGRGFSSGADLKEGFIGADDGGPDILKALHEYYHPVLVGVRKLEKPVLAALQRPDRGDRLLAGAGLRPRAGRRVGLLQPGLREHRPDARRRLDPVRAGGGGQDARLPDGAAGRADPGRRRRWTGAW